MNRRSIQGLMMALLVVLGGSLCTWLMLGRPATGIDDADIFFVYARHLAEGHGLVYNVGGERVEGFTSLLWMLICTGLFRITGHVEIPLYLFNLLGDTFILWFCMRRVRRPVVFLLLMASAPAWFAWCQVTLMETGLWCRLLILAVLAVVERRTVLFSLLLPLLVLTRPESMLWGAWLILMLWVVTASSEGRSKGWRLAARPAMVFAGTMLALVIFRLVYFGYPVPNTFYAKVSPSLAANLWNGAGYLLEFMYTNPAVLLAMLTWIRVLVRGLRQGRAGMDRSTLMALCLLPGVGIPVLVGGDHFGGSRFYQPVWPLLCIIAAEEWPVFFESLNPKKRRPALLALVLCGWILFPCTAMLAHEFRIARTGRETGAALSAMFNDLGPWPTVATITAGGSKYAYPGPVLDLMGLNATEMAHAPGPRNGYKNHTAFNREVFYAWHPDIVLCGEDARFDAYVLKGLPSDERFRQLYVKMAVVRNGREVEAYYSHAFLEHVHQTRQ